MRNRAGRALFWTGLLLAFVGSTFGSQEPDPSSAIAEFHEHYSRVQYRLGGCSDEQMDCSCFVRRLFAEHFDLHLSRDTLHQADELRWVRVPDLEEADQLSAEALCPGDLIYTYSGAGWRAGPRHVAVYAGAERVLHSAASLGGVGFSDLAWLRRFRLHGVFRPLGC